MFRPLTARVVRASIGAFALILSLIAPSEGSAQICPTAPRLLVEPATCVQGASCQVRVLLEAAGNEVPSVSGTLVVPTELSLGVLAAGSCAANGGLFGASPSFVISV